MDFHRKGDEAHYVKYIDHINTKSVISIVADVLFLNQEITLGVHYLHNIC